MVKEDYEVIAYKPPTHLYALRRTIGQKWQAIKSEAVCAEVRRTDIEGAVRRDSV